MISALKDKNTLMGLLFILVISIISFYIAKIHALTELRISPLVIGILIAVLWTNLTNGLMVAKFKGSMGICSKYFLRWGIILYGFKVSITSLLSVGLSGLLVSCIVVSVILIFGYLIGTKILKLDSDVALLIATGSAICGSAAVLAMAGVIKAKEHAVAIAVSTVIIFGTISMFMYPIVFRTGILHLTPRQQGFYIGSTLHGVAHAVAAAAAVGGVGSKVAIVIKMIRVILLVPSLLIVSVIKSNHDNKIHATNTGEKSKLKITIPWFAIIFLLVIILNSYLNLSKIVLEHIATVEEFFLTMAMTALGLKTSIKAFKNSGGQAFTLALIIFAILVIGGYALNRSLG